MRIFAGTSGVASAVHASATVLDQQVRSVAQRLAVHRFQKLIGLDLRRTEDLVTAWWLLNRRRGGSPGCGGSSGRGGDPRRAQ